MNKEIITRRALQFDETDAVQVTIAPNAGACFGVVRAIKLAEGAVGRNRSAGKVYSFGPLIHNPKVVDSLASQGVKIVESAEDVDKGTVILRSHGVKQEVEASLREKGTRIVDATCPLVKKPQRIAAGLAEKGYFLILVGDERHPEVQGVLSYFEKKDYWVTYDSNTLTKIPTSVRRVGIIAQTTIEVSVLDAVVEQAKRQFDEVVVYNTICDATSIRQSEAVELAECADIMVVVGGKNSSNTCKLVKICKDRLPETHHIEEIEEIEPSWFMGKRRIGVTGGASTPHDFVDRVGNHIIELIQNISLR